MNHLNAWEKEVLIQEIISKFCAKCFQTTNNDTTNNNTTTKIEWKNVHFIWKQFISSLSLPNMIYSNTLK